MCSYSARGSSPRTWGTLRRVHFPAVPARFIPTYMGNAWPPRAGPATLQVHPHVHGERIGFILIAGCIGGSSPRTWGTRTSTARHHAPQRFIPTYMGNAYDERMDLSEGAVHPHVHGERKCAESHALRRAGSSPRTWGTPPGVSGDGSGVRFIPTYMGNAGLLRMMGRNTSVHPHVHGERLDPPDTQLTDPGSSPRTWGTHNWKSRGGEPGGSSPRTWGTRSPASIRRVFAWFIPTYMGNASPAWPSNRDRPVHPHVHGERSNAGAHRSPISGSSPRTWGTRLVEGHARILRRFIPTYMGNAGDSAPGPPDDSVHPHVHGERSGGRIPTTRPSGSSPRTWGTLQRPDVRCTWARFIPTYMGNAD